MIKWNILFAICILTLTGFSQDNDDESLIVDKKFAREVEKIAKHKKIVQAFEFIEKQSAAYRAELIRLTEIPAPPFGEGKRAAYYAELLSKSGADTVWIDLVGNVIALKKGTNAGRTVVLDAHLDTVFPLSTDVKVQHRGDTLFAPGIGDDTRGLVMVAAILEAMSKFSVENSANVLFVGSVGEEGLGDLRGVKHLLREGGIPVDSWISIDGGDIGRVNNQGLGSYRYRITYLGPGGHSWGAFGLANPQHALGSAIHYFTESADYFTKNGPKTSYNVGRIGGGTSVNSIAFESWMEIDMRSISPERLDQLDQILKTSVEKALRYQNGIKRMGPDVTVNVEKIGDRPSGESSPDQPLIQRAMAATKYFGTEPRLTIGSTNANIPFSMGIPAITIGRGGKAGGAHSLGEWWYDDEGFKAIQLALLIVAAEAGIK